MSPEAERSLPGCPYTPAAGQPGTGTSLQGRSRPANTCSGPSAHNDTHLPIHDGDMIKGEKDTFPEEYGGGVGRFWKGLEIKGEIHAPAVSCPPPSTSPSDR